LLAFILLLIVANEVSDIVAVAEITEQSDENERESATENIKEINMLAS